MRSRAASPIAAAALAGGRIAIGAGLWVAPRAALSALGFSRPDERTIAIARIAGTRDIVLGVWQASAIGDRAQLARATTAVAACDAGDAVTFALLLGGDERRAAIRGLATAVPATVAGAMLAVTLRGEGS